MSGRSLWALAATVVVAALAAAPASGYSYAVSTPAQITGASPFSGCTIGGTERSTVYTNAEVEPWVDVDPVSGRVVAVWQQDRWSSGSARALGTAVSTDGGLSWVSPLFPPWSLCAGGVAPAGNFPRVVLFQAAHLETQGGSR